MPKVLIDGNYVDVPLDALYADDGTTPFVPPTPQVPGPGDQFFTQADIEKARQEEKDKLYSRLEQTTQELTALREQVGTLSAAEQARQAELQAQQDALEAEARRQQEAELSPQELVERRLAEERAAWESRLNDLSGTLQASEAAREKERQFNEVRDYIAQKVAQHTEGENADIAPEFVQYIDGNTIEEVDAAIARAQASTRSILEQFQQINQQVDPTTGQPFPQQVPVVDPTAVVVGQQAPGVQAPPSFAGSRAWGTPVVDIAGQQQQTLTKEQIDNMPMSEWAKYRSRLGVAPQGQNKGLFG